MQVLVHAIGRVHSPDELFAEKRAERALIGWLSTRWDEPWSKFMLLKYSHSDTTKKFPNTPCVPPFTSIAFLFTIPPATMAIHPKKAHGQLTVVIKLGKQPVLQPMDQSRVQLTNTFNRNKFHSRRKDTPATPLHPLCHRRNSREIARRWASCGSRFLRRNWRWSAPHGSRQATETFAKSAGTGGDRTVQVNESVGPVIRPYEATDCTDTSHKE